MACVNLSSISAETNCVDFDNRGGLVSKIEVAYHSQVASWPDLPTPTSLEDAGSWTGDITLGSSATWAEVPFIEGEGEISVSPTGERGARGAHYELSIMRSKISAETFGLLNAMKDEGLVIKVTDANGNKYLMGDELVPAYMVDGDGAKTGRARTDRNATTINFEYYGQRFLLYDGD